LPQQEIFWHADPSKISKKFHPKIQKFVPAILQKFDRKICIAIITQQKIVS